MKLETAIRLMGFLMALEGGLYEVREGRKRWNSAGFPQVSPLTPQGSVVSMLYFCLHCHSLVALSGREGSLPHPHTSPCHHHEKNPTGT